MRDSSLALAPRSGALLAFDVTEGARWEASTGQLVARSGQRFTWSRGTSTLASVNAATGTYTAPATLPAWEAADSTLGLRLDVNDVLTTPVGWAPQALSGRFTFVERGARTTANATLLAIAGDDPTTGARLYVDTSGTYYRLTAHNGTTSVTATLASGQPTAGQLVDLTFTWTAAGLTLRQAINRAPPAIATAGALTLPAAWPATAKVRIGRRGATQNPAALTLLRCLLVPGVLNVAELEEVW